MTEGSDDIEEWVRRYGDVELEVDDKDAIQSVTESVPDVTSITPPVEDLADAVIANISDPKDAKASDSLDTDSIDTDMVQLPWTSPHGFNPSLMQTRRYLTDNISIEDVQRVYRCNECGVRRPVTEVTSNKDTWVPVTQEECTGRCHGRTEHSHCKGMTWDPVRLEAECIDCGYQTMYWDQSIHPDHLECNECPPEPPEPPDGEPIYSFTGADYSEIDGIYDATEHVREISEIGGVSQARAEELVAAGYTSKTHLKFAKQSEIIQALGGNNALAARIKAEVGEPNDVGEMIVTEVVLQGDTDR